MHRVEKSALVPYSAAQMFDLVAHVADYPRFLAWCTGSRVQPRDDGSVYATLDVRWRGVRSSFTTHNRHDRPARITLRLVDGPFRHLHGEWSFSALRADACKVELKLQFAFVSGVVGRLMGPVFEPISQTLVDAFTRRAEQLYAAPG